MGWECKREPMGLIMRVSTLKATRKAKGSLNGRMAAFSKASSKRTSFMDMVSLSS